MKNLLLFAALFVQVWVAKAETICVVKDNAPRSYDPPFQYYIYNTVSKTNSKLQVAKNVNAMMDLPAYFIKINQSKAICGFYQLEGSATSPYSTSFGNISEDRNQTEASNKNLDVAQISSQSRRDSFEGQSELLDAASAVALAIVPGTPDFDIDLKKQAKSDGIRKCSRVYTYCNEVDGTYQTHTTSGGSLYGTIILRGNN